MHPIAVASRLPDPAVEQRVTELIVGHVALRGVDLLIHSEKPVRRRIDRAFEVGASVWVELWSHCVVANNYGVDVRDEADVDVRVKLPLRLVPTRQPPVILLGVAHLLRRRQTVARVLVHALVVLLLRYVLKH